MKTNIIKISILPLIILTVLEFATLPPQKENNKGNKGNNSQGDGKGQNQKNDNRSQGNSNNSQGNDDRGKDDQGKDNQGKAKNNEDRDNGNRDKQPGNSKQNDGPGKSDKNSDKMNGNDDKGKSKNEGRGRETIRWDRDESINWGFDDFKNRKRPKDLKKVSVCHSTGGDSYPVTINISENALQAHLNHGDQTGSCTTNYSERWPENYVRTRENVYNNYENTWENMSYSEQLARYAAEKLLGIRSNLQRDRSTLSAQEVQRREAVILDLQTNLTGLESQIGVTRQRLDGVNINITL